MIFEQFQHPEGACLSYLMGCTKSGVAGVFEPQLDIDVYVRTLARHGLKLTHIFETHAQADHLSGAQKLSAATGAPVFYNEKATANFPVERLHDNQELFIGNIKLRILHTPGHTNDSMSVVVSDTTRSDEPWFVLSGDTLFVGDVGRPDLDGSAEALYDSVYTKLLQLPDGVEVFPSHYAGSVCGKAMSPKPSSTIGFERRFNPALQFKSKDEFVAFVNSDLPVQPPRFHKVRQFNLGFLKEPPIEKTFDMKALTMTVEAYKAYIDGGAKPVLLDVRNPDEFKRASMGGVEIPLPQLPNRMNELDKNAEIIVLCHHGGRSASAVRILYEAGFKNVKNLAGGIEAWSVKIDPTVPRY